MSDRRSQATVVFLVGAMALYLGASDAALAYVKAGLQPLLVVSGGSWSGWPWPRSCGPAVIRTGISRTGRGWPGCWPCRHWPWY